jgi:hypothetical protein
LNSVDFGWELRADAKSGDEWLSSMEKPGVLGRE